MAVAHGLSEAEPLEVSDDSTEKEAYRVSGRISGGIWVAVGMPRLRATPRTVPARQERSVRAGPEGSPEESQEKRPRALCHATDKELAKEHRRQRRKLLHRFIQASADYRNGYFHRELPKGSYRPPWVTPYKAEGT